MYSTGAVETRVIGELPDDDEDEGDGEEEGSRGFVRRREQWKWRELKRKLEQFLEVKEEKSK